MRTTVVLKETTVFFHQSKKLPQRPSKRTLDRWSDIGRRIVDSTKRVTLEYCYFGPYRVTSVEAFERFHQRVNGELAPARKVKK